jgi:hypothetical protein
MKNHESGRSKPPRKPEGADSRAMRLALKNWARRDDPNRNVEAKSGRQLPRKATS